MIHLELEEFEEAQKHMQGSFETHKALYGLKHERTMGAYLQVAMASRLAGNLHRAKEILETAEDSLLGKAQPWHNCQIVKHCVALIYSVAGLTWKNYVFGPHPCMGLRSGCGGKNAFIKCLN